MHNNTNQSKKPRIYCPLLQKWKNCTCAFQIKLNCESALHY